jgi:hypothetical protein
MVIETFPDTAPVIYARAGDQGRMLPDGLEYVDSWVDESLGRCFQLMETDDPSLFDRWIERWADLGSFEVVPVISSAEAAARVAGRDG